MSDYCDSFNNKVLTTHMWISRFDGCANHESPCRYFVRKKKSYVELRTLQSRLDTWSFLEIHFGPSSRRLAPRDTLAPRKMHFSPSKKKKHFGPYYFGPFSSTYKNCHVYDCFIRNILYIIIDSMDAQYQNKMHPHANVTTV